MPFYTRLTSGGAHIFICTLSFKPLERSEMRQQTMPAGGVDVAGTPLPGRLGISPVHVCVCSCVCVHMCMCRYVCIFCECVCLCLLSRYLIIVWFAQILLIRVPVHSSA